MSEIVDSMLKENWLLVKTNTETGRFRSKKLYKLVREKENTFSSSNIVAEYLWNDSKNKMSVNFPVETVEEFSELPFGAVDYAGRILQLLAFMAVFTPADILHSAPAPVNSKASVEAISLTKLLDAGWSSPFTIEFEDKAEEVIDAWITREQKTRWYASLDDVSIPYAGYVAVNVAVNLRPELTVSGYWGVFQNDLDNVPALQKAGLGNTNDIISLVNGKDSWRDPELAHTIRALSEPDSMEKYNVEIAYQSQRQKGGEYLAAHKLDYDKETQSHISNLIHGVKSTTTVYTTTNESFVLPNEEYVTGIGFQVGKRKGQHLATYRRIAEVLEKENLGIILRKDKPRYGGTEAFVVRNPHVFATLEKYNKATRNSLGYRDYQYYDTASGAWYRCSVMNDIFPE